MDDAGNITHNVSELDHVHLQEVDKIPRAVILLIRLNGLLVLILNSFVLLFILFNRKIFREHVLWTQMISLCLNDAFAGVSILVASFIDNHPFFDSKLGCRLVLVIALTSQLTSLCNIFAIGTHRIWLLKRVNRPGFHFANYKPFYAQISLIVCIGIAFSLIAVYGWPIENGDGINGCEFTAAYGQYKSQATMFISCAFFIPLLLTNVLYMVAYCILKRSLRAIVPVQEDTNTGILTISASWSDNSQTSRNASVKDKKRLTRERNALLIIAFVLIAIDIFTLPTLVMQMNTVFFAEGSQLPRTIKLSVASTITFNSFINPFVYIVRLPEFRKCLLRHIRRIWLSDQSH